MCGTLNSLLYRRLRYALDLYPSVLSGYINLLPLAIIVLPPLPNFTGCSLNCSSTTDDRTKQITEHVKHAHHVRNLQRSRNPNPTYAHQRNCERRCDYHPIRSHLTVVSALFAFVVVRLRRPYTHKISLSTRSLFVGRQKHGGEISAHYLRLYNIYQYPPFLPLL